MLNLLLATMIIGKTEVAPNIIQTEYLSSQQEVIVILDNIRKEKNH